MALDLGKGLNLPPPELSSIFETGTLRPWATSAVFKAASRLKTPSYVPIKFSDWALQFCGGVLTAFAKRMLDAGLGKGKTVQTVAKTKFEYCSIDMVIVDAYSDATTKMGKLSDAELARGEEWPVLEVAGAAGVLSGRLLLSAKAATQYAFILNECLREMIDLVLCNNGAW